MFHVTNLELPLLVHGGGLLVFHCKEPPKEMQSFQETTNPLAFCLSWWHLTGHNDAAGPLLLSNKNIGMNFFHADMAHVRVQFF